MLTELRIRNFAIIEALALPLGPGFNVLSGETGAGKSIIVGALGLLLGERASTDLIRTGADRASVEGTFEVGGRTALIRLLDERGVEVEESLVVLKREIASTGRTRAWINGSPVSASILAEIGRQLVNLHGQHEAQTLLDPDSQWRIVDAFAGAAALADGVRSAHAGWCGVKREIADLEKRRADAERRADYLRHVVREIDDAKLQEGEETRLEEEARRLENVEELRTLAGGVAEAILDEEHGALPRLGGVAKLLSSLQRIDPSLQRLQEQFDGAYYNLESLSREIEDYAAGVELDPERLEAVRRRRDLIFRLVKKYGAGVTEVIRVGHEARQELDLLDSASLDRRQLEGLEREWRSKLEDSASALSAKRAEAAGRLAAAVDEMLPALGIPDGRFLVSLRAHDQIQPSGAEDIEFCVTLNVGHDPRPLARVASGGELSRVMLALETILARLDRVPTLVFDEVDAGIGGRVGLQVGDTMRRVAEHHQVFAITHLPQIAARGHHHIVVSKGAPGGVTTADVTVVSGDARVSEIARMLGGDPESEVSRAHAHELLESATTRPAPSRPSLDEPLRPRTARKKAM